MVYILIVLFIFFGEWKLKNYIEEYYKAGDVTPVFKNRIRVRKYHNHGAFLNFMDKKQLLLHSISILFSICITVVFLLTLGQKGQGLLKLGLSFLLGGAFSNTYDRLKRKYVVDYFSFNSPFPKLNRVVFNLSDFCIIIGALMLVITSYTD